MANYHIRCEDDNVIYAGTLSKTGKLINKSVVTTEAMEAIRNHFLNYAAKENTNELGYRWEYEDGTVVTLKIIVEQKNTERKEE